MTIPATMLATTYAYYAQATDIDGNLGNWVTTANTVKVGGKPRGGSTAEMLAGVSLDQAFQSLDRSFAALSRQSAVPTGSLMASKPQNRCTTEAVDALLRLDRLDAEWLPASKLEEAAATLSQGRAHHRSLIDLALEDTAVSSLLDWRV